VTYVDEVQLRTLTPSVIGILGRRGADFAAAEDAVQDALVEAVRVWPDDPPRDPKGWLVTVAWRKFLDAARADTSRRHREVLRHFLRALFEAAWKNPRALGFVFTLTLMYCHLGPFARHVVSVLRLKWLLLLWL